MIVAHRLTLQTPEEAAMPASSGLFLQALFFNAADPVFPEAVADARYPGAGRPDPASGVPDPDVPDPGVDRPGVGRPDCVDLDSYRFSFQWWRSAPNHVPRWKFPLLGD